MLTEKFDKENYKITEEFMSVKKSNFLLSVILLPIFTAATCGYLLLWDYANIFATFFKITFLLELLIMAVAIFVFLAVAMIVKAIMLSRFADDKFNSVKFKIIKESQKPYCCIKEPIKVGQYQLCLAIYIIIAGIIPYILALIVGDFIFILASFICIFFVGGDLLLFILLFREKSDTYVLDFEGIMLYRLYESKKIIRR